MPEPKASYPGWFSSGLKQIFLSARPFFARTSPALLHTIVVIQCIKILACSTNEVHIPEIIQTPVDLQITPVSGGHEISFRSDNRENGFSGYGIFVAAARSDLTVEPPTTLPPHFCPMVSGQVPFSEPIRVMAGGTAPPGYLCGLSDLLLSSGQFVAVRARVERQKAPWSAAVIGQVP